MELHFALVPKSNPKYADDWFKIVDGNVFSSLWEFYDMYQDGIFLEAKNFPQLFNEGLVKFEMYWIAKVYLNRE